MLARVGSGPTGGRIGWRDKLGCDLGCYPERLSVLAIGDGIEGGAGPPPPRAREETSTRWLTPPYRGWVERPLARAYPVAHRRRACPAAPRQNRLIAAPSAATRAKGSERAAASAKFHSQNSERTHAGYVKKPDTQRKLHVGDGPLNPVHVRICGRPFMWKGRRVRARAADARSGPIGPSPVPERGQDRERTMLSSDRIRRSGSWPSLRAPPHRPGARLR